MSHSGIPDSAAMRRAWDRFCATGDSGHLRAIPAPIAHSWQRSRANGVDPGLTHFPVPEPVPIWTPAEQELKELSEAALQPFQADVHDASVLLTVSESAGRTILREGNRVALRSAESINSVLGALIHEGAIGTNSVGTALFLRDTIIVDFLEHFCEGFQDWADTGVAILHPLTGKLVGAVDFAVHRASLSRSMVTVARAAACAIEARLLEKETRLHRELLLAWGRANRGSADAALAVDRNGIILAVSEGARRLLGAASGDLQGRRLQSIAELRDLGDVTGTADEREVAFSPARAGRIAGALIAPVTGTGGEAGNRAGSVLRLQPVAGPIRSARASRGWSPRFAFDQLIGQSPEFRDAIVLAQKVARTDLPVLIQGDTGTGKEMFAHAIHAASARAEGPFVTVNCGAIPGELIASELFGYEKGAFTGASSLGRRGKFEQAEGGTIFLDEITETSPLLQVSLLRALQEGEIVPIGADQPKKADVRIIAAANRDFGRAIETGHFRRDLYYRLKGVSIRLPALRERSDDIPRLIAHFCAEYPGRPQVEAKALALLMRYPWPGNVRELHAVIRAAALLGDGREIRISDLPAEIQDYAPAPDAVPSPVATINIRAAERAAIERALQACGGNVTEAAALLGIARSSLYRKLHKIGLVRGQSWEVGIEAAGE